MAFSGDVSRRRFLAASLTGVISAGWSGFVLTSGAEAAPTEKLSGKSVETVTVADALLPANPVDVRIEGYVGEKIDLCVSGRVMAQDVEKLIQPFRDKREAGDGDWRSEYWGKWFTSAALACAYQPTPAHYAVIDKAVGELIATADADGYIGSHSPAHRREGWDVWGRKYVLLGLLSAYDLTGDPATLTAARRHADTLLNEIGPGKANIAELGYAAWKGLPPSSILEPMVLLYRRTGDTRYLDFARYIVAQWSTPNRLSPNGMHLIEDALAPDMPVAQYNANKAYEMTSCFEGLCELYRVTGNPSYLKAVQNYGENIFANEIFVVGSGSSREVWFGGKTLQTQANPDPMETCVTATWMKYTYQLLRLTGDSRWADRLEISLYNALLGAQKSDGTWWGYYIPTQGVKGPSHIQHSDVGLSCCVCSGPRALMLTPKWAVMRDPQMGGPVVNLYGRGSATIDLNANGAKVRIDQDTDYPRTDRIRLTVRPLGQRHGAEFPLKLRIPAWSAADHTSLTVNGVDAGVPLTPGAYATLKRRWGAADVVELTLDLRGRVVPDPGGSTQVAVTRGPIVLAWDRRLPAPTIDTNGARLAHAADGTIALTSAPVPKDANLWMSFHAPITTDAAVAPGATPSAASLVLCDYASSGNTWNAESTFKVWLPQPLLNLPVGHDFTGARWIWFGGDKGVPSVKYAPASEFPAGVRYFRQTLSLPAGATIENARLCLTADDSFTLYVNGDQVAQSAEWQSPQTLDLRAHLHAGENALAIEVTNTALSPAGLIARLTVALSRGETRTIVTDQTWQSSATAPTGWPMSGFDAAAWQRAQIVGAYGDAPWGKMD